MKLAIGNDHAGTDYKTKIAALLAEKGIEVLNFGTDGADSVDYPDFAHPTAKAVVEGNATFGILICGSGNGVAITANKYAQIRAALCWNVELATLAREHNDANVLCIPARFVDFETAAAMVVAFLETPFAGGRHQNRVAKISC
ncbi:ribose 5-phosphate isomerase B [Hugenholtzia roseola]|uniref:ribose 5-phosphate isomerase B n=1 Tax=Hugenholtzia roseola TaxID=1002 RepID=UPI0004047955|nr:ribose 5-phosphate isomerase B [Hugenholtzia roseola]